MKLEAHHLIKLSEALDAMEFKDPDTAIEWLIRYSVQGAISYHEGDVARKLLDVVLSNDQEYREVRNWDKHWEKLTKEPISEPETNPT